MSLRLLYVLPLTLILPTPASARPFTNSLGKSIEAELVGVSGDTVTIRQPGGQSFSLPIATFSEADRDYIQKWVAERKARLAATAPKPGETLSFDFPNLPKDFKGQPATMKVRIPANYDPAKPVPLMIFLGGGDGGNDPGGRRGTDEG